MDNNTLNGFEVFEEFMPGSVVNNNTSINDSDIIDGASEELTEEELEALTKKVKVALMTIRMLNRIKKKTKTINRILMMILLRMIKITRMIKQMMIL